MPLSVNGIEQSPAGEWSPSSWRTKKVKQQPVYADPVKHQKALSKLSTLPPLVTPPEVLSITLPLTKIHRLREELKKVALNQKFLLHGGDCAEAFAYSSKVTLASLLVMVGSN
jgi:3-deoxy-7-phosphoheptulonate synthase